jgi:hypothetical protein
MRTRLIATSWVIAFGLLFSPAARADVPSTFWATLLNINPSGCDKNCPIKADIIADLIKGFSRGPAVASKDFNTRDVWDFFAAKFGDRWTGTLGNNEKLLQAIKDSGQESGAVWGASHRVWDAEAKDWRVLNHIFIWWKKDGKIAFMDGDGNPVRLEYSWYRMISDTRPTVGLRDKVRIPSMVMLPNDAADTASTVTGGAAAARRAAQTGSTITGEIETAESAAAKLARIGGRALKVLSWVGHALTVADAGSDIVGGVKDDDNWKIAEGVGKLAAMRIPFGNSIISAGQGAIDWIQKRQDEDLVDRVALAHMHDAQQVPRNLGAGPSDQVDPGWNGIWSPDEGGFVGRFFYDAAGKITRKEWQPGYRPKGNEVFARRGGRPLTARPQTSDDSTITFRDGGDGSGTSRQPGPDDDALIDPATGDVYRQWKSDGQLDMGSTGPAIATPTVQIFIPEWLKNRNVAPPLPNYTGVSRPRNGINTAKLNGGPASGSPNIRIDPALCPECQQDDGGQGPPASTITTPNAAPMPAPAAPRRPLVGAPPRTVTAPHSASPQVQPQKAPPRDTSTITGTDCIDACTGANADAGSCARCRAGGTSQQAAAPPPAKMPYCAKSEGDICGTEKTSAGVRTYWCCSPWSCTGTLGQCSPPPP